MALRRGLPEVQPRSGKALKRKQLELPFSQVPLEGRQRWEYSVLLTSLGWEPLTLAQLYQDRADVENACNELNSQLGLTRGR